MTATMRAVVLDGPGPVTALQVREVPIPTPAPGWVLIKVMAFGLNRSEVFTRLGYSGDAVTYPRILGIEATGVVESAPGGEFAPGTQVAALMGGMGRTYDGGYAEYVCVPASQVVPFSSDLPWAVLGAVPEMLQTAYGSLTVGVGIQPGQSLLIRGGTSSVGMAAAVLAKGMGVTVLATTRTDSKTAALTEIGVDHVLLDDGPLADRVRAIGPGGVHGAIELVGTNTLPDTLRATRTGGTVCFTGMLSGQWTIPDFYPMDYLPNGVRLTAYSGEASDLSPQVLQGFLDAVASGHATVPIDRTFTIDQIAEAHELLGSGRSVGKLVVVTEAAA